MKFRFSSKLAYTTLLAGLATPAAFAQSAGENPFTRNKFTAVTERSQPQFDPQAVRLGTFLLDSSLGVGVGYNDNIFAAANAKKSDTFFQFTPQAELRSDWSNHALSMGFSLNDTEFSSQGDESTTNGEGHIRGRLDVTREFNVGGFFSAARYHEPRYAPSSAGNASEPIPYTISTLGGEANFQRDRIQLHGEVGQTDWDYKSVAATGGGVIDQNFRDNTEKYVSARASYAVSPDVAVYVDGRFADVNYDLPGTVANPSRDGKRTNLHVGLNFELEAPFRGDIGVGYLNDDKDSNSLQRPDFNGLSFDGRLQWFPTQITTVTFQGQRSTFDPGLFAAATAAFTQVGVHVDHELLRNVVLFGELRYQDTDFQGVDRKDNSTNFNVGGGYKLNPHARIDAGYSLFTQNSSGTARDRDLTVNSFNVTLRLFP